jgi:hypothetical protein
MPHVPDENFLPMGYPCASLDPIDRNRRRSIRVLALNSAGLRIVRHHRAAGRAPVPAGSA